MNCFQCKGEIIEKKDTMVFYKKDKKPVFFENIPVNECVQCGDKFISGPVMEKISAILEREELLLKNI